MKIEGFTPGPWRIVKGHNNAVMGANGGVVGFTAFGPLVDDDANAALIAQAPTLYADNQRLRQQVDELRAVLVALMKGCDPHGAFRWPEYRQARAALNNTKG